MPKPKPAPRKGAFTPGGKRKKPGWGGLAQERYDVWVEDVPRSHDDRGTPLVRPGSRSPIGEAMVRRARRTRKK